MNISTAEIIEQVKLSLQINTIKKAIIARQIIVKTAQEQQIEIETSELQTATDEFRSQKKLWSADATWEWLEKHDLSLDNLETIIQEKLLAKKLANHLFADQVEAFFVENKLDYTQVDICEIILDDQDLAMELFFAIQEGEMSFAEVASQYIEDPQLRRRGGYQGKLSRLDFKPEISAAVFASHPPEILKPITMGKKFHLILVEEIREPQLTEKLRSQILEELFSDWLEQQIRQMRSGLSLTLVEA